MIGDRGTLRDPVLESIAVGDPEEFERCVMALAELDIGAACALVHFALLPEVAMTKLAEHPDDDVRVGIAAHPCCPQTLLRKLATDPDSSVRRGVAGNANAPVDLLLTLAADPDEFVRFDVARNPVATEDVQAAFVLSSTPEQVRNARESSWLRSAESDPSLSESKLREMTAGSLSDVNGSLFRSGLAENPNLPEDLIPVLVEAAKNRWEWRSLWSRGLVPRFIYGLVWPSTYAFTVEDAPLWLREALAKHGHPAALLSPGLDGSPAVGEAWCGLRDLINSELLVRALWRELALLGIVELVYWNDAVDGDHFFPQMSGIDLMEAHTPAEYLMGGYSDDREWIETEDTLTVKAVLWRASLDFEEWFEIRGEQFTEQSLEEFAVSGVAFAERFNNLPIRWTSAGEEALENRLIPIMSQDADPEDYETEVTVVDSNLPNIGYAETSDQQKVMLIDLTRQARSNSMMATWGIADHVLMCIALHPATPPFIRDELLVDKSERVRQAAELAANR